MAADSAPFWLNIDKKDRNCMLHLAECNEVTKMHRRKARCRAVAPDLQSILERPEAYHGREWPNQNGGWLAVSSRQQARQVFAELTRFIVAKGRKPYKDPQCPRCH